MNITRYEFHCLQHVREYRNTIKYLNFHKIRSWQLTSMKCQSCAKVGSGNYCSSIKHVSKHTGEENCNKRHVSGEGKQREKQSGCKKEWAREAETIGNTFVNNHTQNNAGLLLTRDITSTIAIQRVCVSVRNCLHGGRQLRTMHCGQNGCNKLLYAGLRAPQLTGVRGTGERMPAKECNECHTCDTNIFYFNKAFARGT